MSQSLKACSSHREYMVSASSSKAHKKAAGAVEARAVGAMRNKNSRDASMHKSGAGLTLSSESKDATALYPASSERQRESCLVQGRG